MKAFLTVTFSLLIAGLCRTQTPGAAINPNGALPDPSSILDVNSSSQGLLIPRLTQAEIDAISSPANGLLLFNTTSSCFNVFKNGGWFEWCGTCIAPEAPVAGEDVALCTGAALNLTASFIEGVTYQWTGPDGFSSSSQNPVIQNVSQDNSGTYQVIAVRQGCSSSPASLEVTIGVIPDAPSSGTHAPDEDQIVWEWEVSPGATEYFYSTQNEFSSATSVGSNTSFTQTGLSCSTTYTLYVWAVSSCGTSGVTTLSQSTATCPGPCAGQTTLTDSRDSQVYPVVGIGTQCWMAANLNYGNQVSVSASQSNNGVVEKYCYSDVSSNCSTYGALYQWYESMSYAATTNATPSGIQGVCPSGWHLPSDAEWKLLELAIGMSQGEVDAYDFRGSLAGGLKSTSPLWNSPNNGATNSSGFNALPGGQCSGGGCSGIGTIARFNTATSQQTYGYADSSQRIERRLQNDLTGIYRPQENTGCCSSTRAFSVRCVKN